LEAESEATDGQRPGEDEEDDEYVEDPDEGLPWPDPVKLRDWWSGNGERFEATTRWRLGRPHGPDVLIETLNSGNQADRHFAAFELSLADPDRIWLECSALCARQRQEMAGLAPPADES
jgi:hypothetical protein